MRFKNIYKKYMEVKHENNLQKYFMLHSMQRDQGLGKILNPNQDGLFRGC